MKIEFVSKSFKFRLSISAMVIVALVSAIYYLA